jgi:protein-disulfide isomerase
MRALFALFAFLTLSAAAPVDFSRTVVATPEGGFRMGSPAAKVKLVEYGSLTCPHCRAFHVEGSASLKRDYVAKGLVSYEYRSLTLNGPDIAASVIARCDGAPAFFPRIDVLYREQSVWTQPFFAMTEDDFKPVQAAPADQQLLAFGKAGKLDVFVGSRGITGPHFARCLSNKALSDKLVQMGQVANGLGVRGTPTFFVNGAIVEGNTWGAIEAKLRTALKLKPKAG